MKLTLAEPKFLKESISIISDIVTEARFKVKKDALELIAMDPANVAMVIFKLLSSAFVEYDVKNEEEICINLNNFKQVLRRSNPTDKITLELMENKLKITMKTSSTRTFYLPIIELEEKDQKVPDLPKFLVTVTAPAAVLSSSIEDVDIVAESVMFIANQNKFLVSAEGDLSKADVEINADEDTKIVVKENEKIKAKYSVEYLKKMMQGSKLADKVTLKFGQNYPLKLEFTELNKVQLAFILAPRVDND